LQSRLSPNYLLKSISSDYNFALMSFDMPLRDSIVRNTSLYLLDFQLLTKSEINIKDNIGRL